MTPAQHHRARSDDTAQVPNSTSRQAAQRPPSAPLTIEAFLDAEDVAAVLAIPVKTIRQYAREERLPCYRVGRRLRFLRSEVQRAVVEGRLGA